MTPQEEKEWADLEAATWAALELVGDLVGGTPWGADRTKPRVYLGGSGRGVAVYLDFPDWPTGDPGDVLGGPRLRVWIDRDVRPLGDLVTDRDRVMRGYRGHLLACVALRQGDADLGRWLMSQPGLLMRDNWFNRIGRDLANGRVGDVRQAVGLGVGGVAAGAGAC